MPTYEVKYAMSEFVKADNPIEAEVKAKEIILDNSPLDEEVEILEVIEI